MRFSKKKNDELMGLCRGCKNSGKGYIYIYIVFEKKAIGDG